MNPAEAPPRELSPITPGDALRRVIGDLPGRVTQQQLAIALGLSRLTVNEILNGRRAITADTAVRLAHVLGTSEEMWLNLQMRLDLHRARADAAAVLPRLPRLRRLERNPPDIGASAR